MSSPNFEFVLNVVSGTTYNLPIAGTVNVSVNWGDGTTTTHTAANPSRLYSISGTVTVQVTGTFTALTGTSVNTATRGALQSVTYLSSVAGLISFSNAFISVTTNFTVNFNSLTSNVTDMNSMFRSCTAFNNPLTGLVTTACNRFTSMFDSATVFNQSIAGLNTANGQFFNFMFFASGFKQSISTMSFANATDLRSMFASMSYPLPITNLNCTINAVSSNMFLNNTGVPSIAFVSNCPLTILGTNAFAGCSALTSMTLPTNLKTLGTSTFQGCSSLSAITLPAITNLGSTCFSGCIALQTVSFANQSVLATVGTNIFSSITSPITGVYYSTNSAAELSTASASLQTQFPASSTFVYDPNPVCFNRGTRIHCHCPETQTDSYVAVEDLRPGKHWVHTFCHGVQPVQRVGFQKILNQPKHFNKCMFRMTASPDNGLTEDLVLSGGHAVLVDDLGDASEVCRQLFDGEIPTIDGKQLLLVAVHPEFVADSSTTAVYDFFQLTLGTEAEPDLRYGVWANGLLVETPSWAQLHSAKGLTFLDN